MTEPSVKLLSADDADRLFSFELENREYFESIGIGRAKEYYDRESFEMILAGLISDQNADRHYRYLVLGPGGVVVGRLNLADVVREPFFKAELGYRIGRAHQRQGYATNAVRLVCEYAKSIHMLHRLEAGASSKNIGSQLVLVRNGFRFAGSYHKYIRRDGVWEDSLLFEKLLDE